MLSESKYGRQILGFKFEKGSLTESTIWMLSFRLEIVLGFFYLNIFFLHSFYAPYRKIYKYILISK